MKPNIATEVVSVVLREISSAQRCAEWCELFHHGNIER